LGLTSARFQWNAAGTALCFEILTGGIRNLWKATVDPATLVVVSMERVTTGPSLDTGAAWSRDGRRLAYAAENEVARLWVYPFDPIGGRITGQGRPVTEEGSTIAESDLSADGRRLAYALTRAGSAPAQLWVSDLDAGTRQMVTQDRAPAGFAMGALSPDGTTMAYCWLRSDKQGAFERSMVMLRSLSGEERPISTWNTQSMFFPNSWTHDERALIGSLLPLRGTGDASLAVWPTTRRDAEGPDRILVSEKDASIWQGETSPDGRWLSFVVQRRSQPDRLETVIAPFDAPSPDRWIRVASDHQWPDKPRWAPDGRTLYFLSGKGGMYLNVWGIRFDPQAGRPMGAPFAITKMDSPSRVISPDFQKTEMHVAAHRLVLTMQTTTGNIWMLQDVDR